jgi:hypothetical protein
MFNFKIMFSFIYGSLVMFRVKYYFKYKLY